MRAVPRKIDSKAHSVSHFSYNSIDHLSSRDIVPKDDGDKSNGTDMIMGNLSNGENN